ncbi:MAG: hypothetical protein Q9195_006428 [Heterodermia aff. obscurata]
MAELEEYIKKVYTHESKYPGCLPKGRVFPSTDATPKLNPTQTSRILVYNGSFNPPHRGHLHLLEHTFHHGSHDLNLIAAVIYPSRDNCLEEKRKKAGSNFRFGRDERSMLWKRDSCFPNWAWVHEAHGLVGFLRSLKDVTSKDGYDVEYVHLQGPSSDDHLQPPDEDAFLGGCSDTLVISDAARSTNYQRSSGLMRNFHGWTNWKRIRVDENEMLKLAELKTQAVSHGAIQVDPTDNEQKSDDSDEFLSQYPLHRVAEFGESPPREFEWSWEDCENMKKPGRWMQEPISNMDIDPVATDTIDDDNPCEDQLQEQEILQLLPHTMPDFLIPGASRTREEETDSIQGSFSAVIQHLITKINSEPPFLPQFSVKEYDPAEFAADTNLKSWVAAIEANPQFGNMTVPGKIHEEFMVYWEKLVDLCGRLVTMDESVLEERDWFEERKEMIEIVRLGGIMDHLPQVTPAFQHPDVPYLYNEAYPYIYDNDKDLFHFPKRMGWDIDQFLSGKYDGDGPNTPEKATSLIQAWLYFGLVHMITGIPMQTEDFLRTTTSQLKVITTAKLPRILEQWRQSIAERTQDEQREYGDFLDSRFDAFKPYLSLLCNNDCLPQEVRHSMSILQSTLRQMKMAMFPASTRIPDSALGDFDKAIKARLLEDEW